jgi:hypothetical protein
MNSEPISPGTVFISYAREDRNRVELIVKYLADIGLDVWWDRDIEVGTSFRSAIQNSLDEAACVLVIWTTASVEKDFVHSEASIGQQKGILLPLLLDAKACTLTLRLTPKGLPPDAARRPPFKGGPEVTGEQV